MQTRFRECRCFFFRGKISAEPRPATKTCGPLVCSSEVTSGRRLARPRRARRSGHAAQRDTMVLARARRARGGTSRASPPVRDAPTTWTLLAFLLAFPSPARAQFGPFGSEGSGAATCDIDISTIRLDPTLGEMCDPAKQGDGLCDACICDMADRILEAGYARPVPRRFRLRRRVRAPRQASARVESPHRHDDRRVAVHGHALPASPSSRRGTGWWRRGGDRVDRRRAGGVVGTRGPGFRRSRRPPPTAPRLTPKTPPRDPRRRNCSPRSRMYAARPRRPPPPPPGTRSRGRCSAAAGPGRNRGRERRRRRAAAAAAALVLGATAWYLLRERRRATPDAHADVVEERRARAPRGWSFRM